MRLPSTIVGVASSKWAIDELHRHAHKSLAGADEAARGKKPCGESHPIEDPT
ncbi:MAG: hypothetical protein GY708_08950 [Actinomycetia bacterium]|nr:hypothetical protein [Actinomycetes bacterium]